MATVLTRLMVEMEERRKIEEAAKKAMVAKKMKRSIMTIGLSVGVLIGGTSFVVGHFDSLPALEESVKWNVVVVESGDDLWSIAARANSDVVDIRDIVHLIQEENGIDSVIKPGQRINVPTYTGSGKYKY